MLRMWQRCQCLHLAEEAAVRKFGHRWRGSGLGAMSCEVAVLQPGPSTKGSLGLRGPYSQGADDAEQFVLVKHVLDHVGAKKPS